MIHTETQLNNLTVKEVKEIAASLGITPAFRKVTVIQQILNYQNRQESVETSTCATCPHFQQFEGEQRGMCCKFDMVSRAHWEKTQDCEDEVSKSNKSEPAPIIDNEDGSFLVLSSTCSHYYRVQGDRCTCAAASFGRSCRHTKEAAEYILSQQSQELEAYLESGVATMKATESPSLYRYSVELASDALDQDGVPDEFRVVSVAVTEPTQAAITQLLNATGQLDGFTVVDFWSPDGDIEF